MVDHTSRLEVTNKEIKGLKLGQKVTVVQEGTITELTAEHSFDEVPATATGKKKKEVFPPQITIEVSKTTIKGNDNQFEDLLED